MAQIKLPPSLESLTSAEDFLEYFNIPFDQAIVTPRRIALLRNFNKELEKIPEPRKYRSYKTALTRAYRALLIGDNLPLASSRCATCSECDDSETEGV